ncbi:hypothetical protein [Plastoroseomonas arctica]|uniref:DUF1902 domain-containing protein n=1 Tax=Plastoroseomonas arctica TaxID=1509237 RepID=A0AAF1JUY2_9PROT|nr:hypothetical protein [Plastoroseomonas arctica]MBR0653657.1 hypothetical protein [Plastoroseomonas arctica]
MEKTPVRIIAFQEDGMFIAHCVDHDIAASAVSLDAAIRRLRLTVEAERVYAEQHDKAIFEGVGRAPQYVTDMFDAAYLNVSSDGAKQVPPFRLAA